MAAPSEPSFVHSRRGQPCPAADCVGVHSYTADDVRWCLPGVDPDQVAIDVELTDAEPPRLLVARQQGTGDFWQAWTRLEVVAKLTRTPILALVARGELGRPSAPDIRLSHVEHPTATICIGHRDVLT